MTPAGTSPNLTSRINAMKTHTHTHHTRKKGVLGEFHDDPISSISERGRVITTDPLGDGNCMFPYLFETLRWWFLRRRKQFETLKRGSALEQNFPK